MHSSDNGLIPATILTGFLGAGKTTLLKRILTEAHGQKIAVIENEFGEENIDTDILVSDTNEQIIQMNNGCVCCTIREDLRTTLSDLAAKRRKGELTFDRVIIETTGLANELLFAFAFIAGSQRVVENHHPFRPRVFLDQRFHTGQFFLLRGIHLLLANAAQFALDRVC